MTKIFKKYKICTLINISISQISNSTIDDAILEQIQAKYENKITKYGYIKENSIEIIKRSAGTAMKEHFNSSFQFKAVCYALICNPSIDTILEAKIVSSNNAGFKAEVSDDNDKVIIDIIIPRLTSGIKHEYDIEDLSIGSDVSVKICRKRYHYNDNKIVIIGLVINNPNDDNTEEPEELVDTINTEKSEKNEADNFSEDASYEQDDAVDSTDDSDSVIDLVDLKDDDIDVVNNTANDVVNIETDDDDDDDNDNDDDDYD